MSHLGTMGKEVHTLQEELMDDRTPIEKLVGKLAPGTAERLEEDIQKIAKGIR